ncbi:SRPBCC domain-containing protein [Streptomyces sp. GC420]|uniref:SRPBCC family protein n=1 Tax=Streptomyces sp. GC420 TaxID=2697568 RepID=UPI001414E5C4|nr:hypothetical protein [Streptomyces sp. GC420]NBM18009.1 hypothetical protein [Streptomyces sp. GC420]
MTGLTKAFRVEVNIDASADTVWRALTVPGRIQEWFGWEYEGLTEEVAYLFADHADPQPPDRVGLPGGQEICLIGARGHTTVRVTTTDILPDADTGTGTDTGTGPVTGTETRDKGKDRFDEVEEGWRVFLQQLRFLLERHPEAGRRRTLRLTGRATGSGLLAALEPAEAKEVWHESRFAHLVVDREDHLLAALAERPLTEVGLGPVSLTVTAYGLDAEGFAELRRRWTTRWEDAVDEPGPAIPG